MKTSKNTNTNTNRKTKYRKKKNIYRGKGGSKGLPKRKSICVTLKTYSNDLEKMGKEIEIMINKIISKKKPFSTNSYNDTRAKELNILANVIEQNNSNITMIYLYENNINDSEVKILVEALKKNNKITNINLYKNNITIIGMNYLLDLLKTNVTIKGIDLNPISNTTDKIITSTITLINRILNARFSILNKFEPNLTTLGNIIDIENKVIENKIECIKNEIEFTEISGMTFDNKVKILFTKYKDFKNLIKNNYYAGIDKIKRIKTIDNNNVIVSISLHGQTMDNFFKLPDNINIVFLSPVSYLTCSETKTIEKYIENRIQEFLENPSCFNKEYSNKIFSESVIYYGGQYCINTILSRSSSTDPNEHVTGIKIYVKNTHPPNLSNNINIFSASKVPYRPLDKLAYISNLSEFIKEYFSRDTDITYTLIFQSCREVDKNYPKNKNYLVFYEQTIKNLNSIIYYDFYMKKNSTNITNITEYSNYYNNYCIGEATALDISRDKTKNMWHVQNNKTNNDTKFIVNNIRSAKKTKINEKSKMYLDDSLIGVYQNDLFDAKDKHTDAFNKQYVFIKDIKSYISEKIKKKIHGSVAYILTYYKLTIDSIYTSLYSLFFIAQPDSILYIYKKTNSIYFSKQSLNYFKFIKYILDNKLFIEFIFYYLNKGESNDSYEIYMKRLKILINNKNIPELYTLTEIIVNYPIKFKGFDVILDILQNNKNLTSLSLQNVDIKDDNECENIIKLLDALLTRDNTNLKNINLKNKNINKNNIIIDKNLDASKKPGIFNFLKKKKRHSVCTSASSFRVYWSR